MSARWPNIWPGAYRAAGRQVRLSTEGEGSGSAQVPQVPQVSQALEQVAAAAQPELAANIPDALADLGIDLYSVTAYDSRIRRGHEATILAPGQVRLWKLAALSLSVASLENGGHGKPRAVWLGLNRQTREVFVFLRSIPGFEPAQVTWAPSHSWARFSIAGLLRSRQMEMPEGDEWTVAVSRRADLPTGPCLVISLAVQLDHMVRKPGERRADKAESPRAALNDRVTG